MSISRMCAVVAASSVAIAAGNALAVTTDGDLTGDGYGAALALQTVQTQFGDNASEMNGIYAQVNGGKLSIMFTGNIENNFNKFELFLDSRTGGQNVYNSAGNDNTGNMNGMTFDSGFTADYHIVARRGSSKFDLDFADLQNGTFSDYFDVFGGADFGSGTTGTGVNANPIDVGYNGSNAAGILGGTGAADQVAAAAVTTGFEITIDLADLGFNQATQDTLMIFAFQNNDGHNFASNQALPGLPAGTNNLGGDGSGNFTGSLNFDWNTFYPGQGDGYVSLVIPAPGTALLGALGLAAMRRRR